MRLNRFIMHKFLPILAVLAPASVLAQTLNDYQGSASDPTLVTYLYVFTSLLNYIVPVIFAIAIIYFFWGVVKFVIADSEQAKDKGRDTIVYGLIGLVVMFSVYGLIKVVQKTFGIDKAGSQLTTPTLTVPQR